MAEARQHLAAYDNNAFDRTSVMSLDSDDEEQLRAYGQGGFAATSSRPAALEEPRNEMASYAQVSRQPSNSAIDLVGRHQQQTQQQKQQRQQQRAPVRTVVHRMPWDRDQDAQGGNRSQKTSASSSTHQQQQQQQQQQGGGGRHRRRNTHTGTHTDEHSGGHSPRTRSIRFLPRSPSVRESWRRRSVKRQSQRNSNNAFKVFSKHLLPSEEQITDRPLWLKLTGTMPEASRFINNRAAGRPRKPKDGSQSSPAQHKHQPFQQQRPQPQLPRPSWLVLLFWQLVAFCDSVLRGVGQIYFLNNPISGLAIVAALYVADVPWVATMGLFGAVLATVAAMMLSLNHHAIRNGLFGFNGFLVGAALAIFNAQSTSPWDRPLLGPIAVCSIFSTVLMASLGNMLIPTFAVPPFTLPFNLATIVFLAGCMGYDYFPSSLTVDAPPYAYPSERAGTITIDTGELFLGILRSFGQVVFAHTWQAGAVVAAGMLVCSPINTAMAFLGALSAAGTGVALGVDPDLLYSGLYGFNSVLTGIVAGGMFFVISPRSVALTVFGGVTTALVRDALATALKPVGLPGMTLPFCLVAIAIVLLQGSVKYLVPVKLTSMTVAEDHARRFYITRKVVRDFEAILRQLSFSNLGGGSGSSDGKAGGPGSQKGSSDDGRKTMGSAATTVDSEIRGTDSGWEDHEESDTSPAQQKKSASSQSHRLSGSPLVFRSNASDVPTERKATALPSRQQPHLDQQPQLHHDSGLSMDRVVLMDADAGNVGAGKHGATAANNNNTSKGDEFDVPSAWRGSGSALKRGLSKKVAEAGPRLRRNSLDGTDHVFHGIFMELDKECTGYVSAVEIAAALERLGCGESRETVQVLFNEAGVGQSGRLNRDEFVQFMRYRSTITTEMKAFAAYFKLVDADDSGTVSLNDLLDTIQQIDGHHIGAEQLRCLFQRFFGSADVELTLSDLTSLIVAAKHSAKLDEPQRGNSGNSGGSATANVVVSSSEV